MKTPTELWAKLDETRFDLAFDKFWRKLTKADANEISECIYKSAIKKAAREMLNDELLKYYRGD